MPTLSAPANTATTPRDLAPRSCPDLVTRSMPMRGDSVNEETREFDVTFATERVVSVYDWESDRIVDEILSADGAEIADELPLLDSHSRWRCEDVVGRMHSHRIVEEDGERVVVMRAQVIRTDPATDPTPERIWSRIQQRALRNFSAGYRVLERTIVRAGQSTQINGRTYTAGQRDLRIATRWMAREGSLTPVGADERSTIRQEITMPQIAPTNPAGGPGEATRTEAPPPALAATNAQLEAARAEERSRIEAIQALAGNATPEQIRAAIADPAMTAQALALSVLTARNEAAPRPVPPPLDAARHHTNGAPNAIVRDHERDCTFDVLSAAFSMTHNAPVVRSEANTSRVRRLPQAEADTLRERADRYVGLPIVDYVRECCRFMGIDRPFGRPDQIWREAIDGERRMALTGRSGFSGGTVSAFFNQTLGGLLLQAFEAYPDTTAAWTRRGTLRNFQPTVRTQRGGSSKLTKLLPGGTAKHDAPNARESLIRAYRYADRLVVDEQHIINDNFGELANQAEEFGRAAGELVPDLVYSILLSNPSIDGTALFHVDHGNLLTGSDSAISNESIAAMMAAMLSQTDGPRRLNLRLAHVLVPPILWDKAFSEILSPEKRNNAASATYGTLNPIYGELPRPIIEPRLGTAGVIDPDTGDTHVGTDTNWFGAANPQAAPTIEVSFVGGQNLPQIRSGLLDNGQYGVWTDIKNDVGAAVHSHHALAKSDGT